MAVSFGGRHYRRSVWHRACRRVALTIFVVGSLGASQTTAWDVSLGGSQCKTHGGNSIAVDQVGNIVTAGRVNSRFAVAKYDGAKGLPLWQEVIDGLGLWGQALVVTLDASGDVIAAGQIYDTGYQIAVVKLSGADGSEMWRGQIANKIAYNQPTSVIADSLGNIIVGGSVGAQGNGDHPEMLVTKLNGGNGTPQWVYITGRSFYPWGAEASALLISPEDDVLVGGHMDGSSGPRFTVLKLDGRAGSVLWNYGSDGGRLFGMASIGQGDVVAAGRFVVRLRGGDGSEVWRVRREDVARAIAVDANEDVIVLGSSSVTKLRGDDGQEVWSQATPLSIFHQLVAVDHAGDVFIAGDFPGGGILKLSGLTGVPIWSFPKESTSVGLEARSIALDEADNLTAVGLEPITGAGYTTIKLRGTDGSLFGTTACAGDCDFSSAVAIDEILRGVNMALGIAPACDCRSFDLNRDGRVTIDELVRATGAALGSCRREAEQ